MTPPNPYAPDDAIWLQFEDAEGRTGEAELATGADLDDARAFVADNPGWKLSHWQATPREVHHVNEGYYLGNL
jgi:hypothetical protein